MFREISADPGCSSIRIPRNSLVYGKGDGGSNIREQGNKKANGQTAGTPPPTAGPPGPQAPSLPRSLVSCFSQVSAKALAESKLITGGIDAPQLSRYSQGQIPDLVAHTIPRSSKAAQSKRSALPSVLRFIHRQQPAPLRASAMFASQVHLSFPAVALQVAAGFFLNPQTEPWRL